MPNRAPASRRISCARCGTVFDCGLGGACWCASEPVRLPMPTATASEDCVCRDCLRALTAVSGVIRDSR